MTRILRDELSALADDGMGRMATADDLAALMSVRFAHARRRRPAIIAGTTCLVLVTAGAAAAGVSLLRVEVTDLPDRLTTGAAAPAAPTGLRCGRELGEIQPSVLPMVLMADDPENVPATTVDLAQRSESELWMPPLRAINATTGDIDVTMGSTVGLYLVEDGVIIAEPGPAGATVDETVTAGQGSGILPDRPVLCAGGDASDGTYEAYGSLEVTVHGGGSAGTYDIVGGPWTVVLAPTVEMFVVPEQPGIPGLTSIDPAASSLLQCGAQVGALGVGPGARSAGSDDRSIDPPIGWTGAVDPAARPVDASGRSTISLRTEVVGGAATGYPTTAPAFVIVTEGVVVGTSTPDGPSRVQATDPVDLDTQAAVSGSVLYRACSAAAADVGPLPAGRYSIWVTQGYHLTERADAVPPGGALVGRVVDEDVAAFGRAADLWIGADGRPVPSPGPAAGWPTAVPPDVVSAGTSGERSVVWFAVSDGDVADLLWRGHAQDALAQAGYGSAALPVACQPRAHSVLNLPKDSTDATGVGVIFATRAEADAFADLVVYPSTIVQGEMSCDLT